MPLRQEAKDDTYRSDVGVEDGGGSMTEMNAKDIEIVVETLRLLSFGEQRIVHKLAFTRVANALSKQPISVARIAAEGAAYLAYTKALGVIEAAYIEAMEPIEAARKASVIAYNQAHSPLRAAYLEATQPVEAAYREAMAEAKTL